MGRSFRSRSRSSFGSFPAERGPASAVIGVPVLLAPAFGPTIGGFLTTTFNWNAIFTVNLPIGIAAFVFGLLILQGRDAERASLGTGPGGPEGPTTRRRFDIAGLLLSMAGFTAFVYGISHAGDTRADNTTIGWSDPTVVTYIVIGVVLLALFVVNELLVSDPVIDVRLFRIYTFTSANVLTWAFSALFFGSVFLLPNFFQTVPNPPLTAFDAGAVFITQGLAAALATVLVGRLYNRIGPRILITLGFVLAVIGTYGLTQFTVTTTGASIQGWLILRGLRPWLHQYSAANPGGVGSDGNTRDGARLVTGERYPAGGWRDWDNTHHHFLQPADDCGGAQRDRHLPWLARQESKRKHLAQRRSGTFLRMQSTHVFRSWRRRTSCRTASRTESIAPS